MSLAALLKGRGPSGFGYGSTAEEVTEGIDLSGKRFLVTGVGSGLGLETARVLALRGAHVVGLARTEKGAASALESVSAEGTPVACDLSEPASVRAAVDKVKDGAPLDGILCNAGVMALPKREVKHGIELQLLTNHFGHFLLVTGLLDRLTETGRVVVVSSAAHRYAPREGVRLDDLDASRGYNPWLAYGQSKLANILFTRALARRLASTKRTTNALHPGVIKTNLGRHMGTLFQIGYAIGEAIAFKTIPQGAATQCYVATHPSLLEVSGKYYADCNVARTSRIAQDDALAEALWEKSEEIARRL